MQILGSRLKAGNHEVHEPSEADTNHAADAVQRDCLQQQACHESTFVLVNETVVGMHDELSATGRAAMILFGCVKMPIFLELPRCTYWTRLSYDQSCLLPPRYL